MKIKRSVLKYLMIAITFFSLLSYIFFVLLKTSDNLIIKKLQVSGLLLRYTSLNWKFIAFDYFFLTLRL